MSIQIVIASNSADFRRIIKAALEPIPDFEVCAEVTALDEAPAIIHEFKPELVLLESSLVESGREFEPHVVQFQGHEVRIVSVRRLDDGGLELASAEGFSVRVEDGEITNQLARALLMVSGMEIDPKGGENLAEDAQVVESLTDKELEILEIMAEGKPNSEIAEDLVISENTVRFHISHILKKLAVTNRTQAVVEAIKKRILKI